MISQCTQLRPDNGQTGTKGAVKLHLLLDHDGFLPCYAVITEGQQHEIGVARQLRSEPGTLLMMDQIGPFTPSNADTVLTP